MTGLTEYLELKLNGSTMIDPASIATIFSKAFASELAQYIWPSVFWLMMMLVGFALYYSRRDLLSLIDWISRPTPKVGEKYIVRDDKYTVIEVSIFRQRVVLGMHDKNERLIGVVDMSLCQWDGEWKIKLNMELNGENTAKNN